MQILLAFDHMRFRKTWFRRTIEAQKTRRPALQDILEKRVRELGEAISSRTKVFARRINKDLSVVYEVAWQETRGQSPRDSVAECLLFSVADGRFDREIKRFEELCPVVKAPFAPLATPLAGGNALTSG
jgi:hypothetical protein